MGLGDETKAMAKTLHSRWEDNLIQQYFEDGYTYDHRYYIYVMMRSEVFKIATWCETDSRSTEKAIKGHGTEKTRSEYRKFSGSR